MNAKIIATLSGILGGLLLLAPTLAGQITIAPSSLPPALNTTNTNSTTPGNYVPSTGNLRGIYKGTWAFGVTYGYGDLVTTPAGMYVSLRYGNANNPPAAFPGSWQAAFSPTPMSLNGNLPGSPTILGSVNVTPAGYSQLMSLFVSLVPNTATTVGVGVQTNGTIAQISNRLGNGANLWINSGNTFWAPGQTNPQVSSAITNQLTWDYWNGTAQTTCARNMSVASNTSYNATPSRFRWTIQMSSCLPIDVIDNSSASSTYTYSGYSSFSFGTATLATTAYSNASGIGFNSSGVAYAVPQDTSVAIPVLTAIPANTCWGGGGTTTATTFTMTNLTTAMGVDARQTGDPSALVGYGASGGLSIVVWPSSANTGSYKVCNQTAAAITSSAITVRMVAQ